ncbi:SCP-like protein [Ancylostoma duodenale]|uniref:SCP-like protein n=1 Tax=Ancylostoma duodenale TaxID=51022 RepID=A0A0C2DWE9_9BILA|nr:SCP-like protein [Ancylostoma duodenale]
MVVITASVTVGLTLLQLSTNAFATTAFNCKNSLITDEWREAILNLHNQNRRKVADGKQRGESALLPKAAKMNQLQWDCATEEIAQIEVAKCGRQALVPPPGYGTIATKMRIRGNCDPTALTKTAIRDAWKKGAAQQASNLYDAANTKFNMMAYQDTDGIGCSYRRCSRNLYIVCFYNIEYEFLNFVVYQDTA